MSILLVVKIFFKEIPILYFSARITGGLDNFVSYETNLMKLIGINLTDLIPL